MLGQMSFKSPSTEGKKIPKAFKETFFFFFDYLKGH